jgi:hypothetical protein
VQSGVDAGNATTVPANGPHRGAEGSWPTLTFLGFAAGHVAAARRRERRIGDHVPVTAIRLVLIAVAVSACAWFALAIRSTHDENSVTDLISAHNNLTPEQAAAAERTLSRARVLDPDEQLNVLRAQVDFHAGFAQRAVALERGIVGREPDNAEAWFVLILMSKRINPSLARLAQQRVAQLVPSVAPPR